jgi:hypothetical protein
VQGADKHQLFLLPKSAVLTLARSLQKMVHLFRENALHAFEIQKVKADKDRE